MTFFGPHERTVVQGSDWCICGEEWPCPQSAEGRWASLREWLKTAGQEARQAQVTMVPKATVLAQVVDKMDEMEGI